MVFSQTAGIPPTTTAPEQSWSSFEAFASLFHPGAGLRQGGKLGIPLASGQPTTGLTPTLTAGTLLVGNKIFGISPKATVVAPKNVANRKLFFGLSGLYYAGATNTAAKATDVLVGEVTTDNAATASIISVGQPINLGAGRLGIRSLVNLAVAVDGADQDLFSWTRPAGYDYVRMLYCQSRLLTPVTAGNTAGDDFLIKLKVDAAAAVTVNTIAVADILTTGFTARATPDDSDVYSWYQPTTIKLQYNQTDTATALAGGLVETIVTFEVA